MAQRAKCTCGLEIGKGTISLVQYYHEENTVAGVAIKPIDTSARQWWSSVESEFKDLVGSMKLNGLNIVVSLPAESAVIKQLSLDANEPDVDGAVRWEMAQHLIGSLDDYFIDFERLPGLYKGDVAAYLLAACNAKAIADATALIRSHKLNPIIVDLDVFALVNLLETCRPELVEAPAFIVCGTEDYSKVILTRNGGFIDCEMIKTGADAPDAAAYASLVTGACSRLASLNGAVVEGKQPATLLSGVLFADEAFAAGCIEGLGNAEILSPFSTIGCRAISAEDTQKYAPQLGVAVGLALRGVKG